MKVSKVTGYLLCGMILVAGILFFVENNALAEDVTITTYYPAPYGVYRELIATPIMGRWRQTSSMVGDGNYVWDDQMRNTNTDYLGWSAGQSYITIKQAGYYLISANVLQYQLADNERGDVYIRRNATNLAYSLGIGGAVQQYYKHHLTIAEYFDANDNVYIYQASSGAGRYGGGYWTTLSIVRLN